MNGTSRRVLLGGVGASLLGACSRPLTVAASEPEDVPIGGIGGTGIVGMLVDFGSLIVNGIRLETDASTAVTDAFGGMALSALDIGDSLTIEAEPSGDSLLARRVHVTHPLIGPVDRVSADGRHLRVLGVAVALDPGSVAEAAPGTRVAVSGVWKGKEVMASRVVARPQPAVSVMAGAVKRRADGSLAIGGVPLLLKPGVPSPQAGSFVTVRGKGSAAGFKVLSLDEGRFTGAAGPIARLSVEGYLYPVDKAPFHEISGLGHSFDAGAQLDRFADARWLFDGPYSGTFDVATGTALPENLAERRRLLTAVLKGASAVEPLPAR